MASQTYSDIVREVERFLNESKATSTKSAKNNKQIVAQLRNLIQNSALDVQVTDGTILNYLSHAANYDESTPIVSGGPYGGYWIDESSIQEPETDEETEQLKVAGKSEGVSERDLYPLVRLWLGKKGYTARDVSGLKKGGKWGNPDIVGVDRIEMMGSVEWEIASCEVKLSDENWEQVIFEAISHKRFSNRSWFCYRTAVRDAPLPKGMEYYAERYRVGVVHIVLTDAEFIKLKNSDDPIDYIDNVFERVPALYDHVALREKSELMTRANISVSVHF